MKAILKFDLSDPDERDEHTLALSGRNFEGAFIDIRNLLRSKYKMDKDEVITSEELFKIIDDNNLTGIA